MNEQNADSGPSQASELRRAAERRLCDKDATPVESMAEVDARALVHELQVHQIELEMQNEDLQRTEAALQEVSDNYQDLFDFAPIGYFRLDEQGRILEVNLAGASLLGLDRSAAVKLRLGQYVAPQSRAQFAEFLRDVLHAGSKQTREIELQRDGELVYVVMEGVPLQDGGAKPSLRVMVADITDRKRVEQELSESRQRLAGIVSSAMDAIVSVDAAHRIVLFNAAAEKMFCCPAAEAVGQPLDRFIPERFRAAHAGHMTAFGEAGTTSRAMGQLTTLSALRADGEEFPMEASISQSEVRGQKVFTVILRDITARKRAEETLQQTAEELARSNKDLDQFASVISHDLQEPLRSVSGFVQLLQKKYTNQLDSEADTFIGYAVDGTRRMETLIKDLLAYSRVSTRRRIPVLSDAGAALGEALKSLRESIGETGAEITHSELPTVWADPSQLIQLFQNLIGNALKFHGETPPKIHVDACRNEDHWVFSVRDNGIGIAPQFQDQIFEIFRRLHTQKQYAGTGVGLAICKKIVERYGGRTWVESQPGQGATFSFTLPI
jgi:PAS domain S-box-containing protein